MLHRLCLVLAAVVAMVAVAVAAPRVPHAAIAVDRGLVVEVQSGPQGLINPQRDCQTIRQCNFTRDGAFRGCISAYSCKVCRLVKSRCSIGSSTGICEKFVCDWGA